MFDLETKKEDSIKESPDEKPYQVYLNEYLYEQLNKGDRPSFGTRMAEDREFFNGVQWTQTDSGSQKADGWQPLPDFEATACIEQLIAVLTSKQPRWGATARENSDVTTANYVADLMSYIWDISHGDLKLKQAVKDYEVVGIGAMMPYVDPYADFGKGEIKLMDIDPQYLYISADATDPLSKEATHKILSKVLTGESIQALYPKVNLNKALSEEDNTPTGSGYNREDTVFKISDTDHKKYRVIDRYSKILVPYFNVYDPYMDKEYDLTQEEYVEFAQQPAVIERSANSIRIITEPSEVKKQMQILETYGSIYHFMLDSQGQPQIMPGVEHEGAIPFSQVDLELTTIQRLLEDGSIKWSKYKATRIQRVLSCGGQLIEDKILPLDTHPIVTFMCNHNRNPYPMSNMRKVKPYVEQLIYYHSILIKHTSRSTNVTIIIGKGAHNLEEIKKKINSPAVEVIEVDWELPGAQPVILYPQQLSNELFGHIKELKYQIQRILGSYEASDGSSEGAHPTKGGLLAQDEMRLRRAESTRKDIEVMLNELGNVVSQMLPMVYDSKKIIRLLGNNDTKETVLNDPQEIDGMLKIVNDVHTVKYDIKCVSGSMLPSNRWARAEYFMGLWERGILRDEEVILRESEIPNLEKVLEKQSYIKQLEGALQQSQEEIKRLNGDMQTAERELRHADRQVEKEKFKSNLGVITGDLKGEAKAVKAKMNTLTKEKENGSNT